MGERYQLAMSIFVDVNSLPKPYPQVIKVDGQCYQIVGGTEQAAGRIRRLR
jgi:hypothetical protein